MGIFDIFKSFFQSSPTTNGDPSRLPPNIENDLRRDILSNHEDINSIMTFTENNDTKHIMEEMESLFENFFNFGIKADNFFGSLPSNNHDENKTQSLRDKMLNEKEEVPFDEDRQFNFFTGNLPSIFKFPIENDIFRNTDETDEKQIYDEDFDSDISSGKKSLDDVLNEKTSHNSFNISSLPKNGIFNFSSTTKKINSDGYIETRTTKKLPDGSEQTVVSRSIGDQTHSVTSKKLASGEEIRTEDFVNMNQDELKAFDEKWNIKKGPLLPNGSSWGSFIPRPWSNPKL
ncbi:uncharacterized protein LOC100199317 isoform X2 [Hydra vulgaris]|uniref:Uncharacterized protein LOC100199317 isoform X2 n=1 Tax=Hydra vulgaris TaxID=6087 RepID=A0ABM4DAS3_HYDVU